MILAASALALLGKSSEHRPHSCVCAACTCEQIWQEVCCPSSKAWFPDCGLWLEQGSHSALGSGLGQLGLGQLGLGLGQLGSGLGQLSLGQLGSGLGHLLVALRNLFKPTSAAEFAGACRLRACRDGWLVAVVMLATAALSRALSIEKQSCTEFGSVFGCA